MSGGGRIRLLLAGLLLVSSLLCGASAVAESKRPPPEHFLRERALHSGLAMEIVTDLTTSVGPRLAGTPADHRAVDWAEAMLRRIGFDRVWRERVDFPVWERRRELARVVSPAPQPLLVTALGGSGSTDGELVAEVAAFPDLAALERAEPEQVAGKIVFINQPTRRARDGSGYGDAVPVRYDAAGLAAARGARAVLIRSIGTDSHRFPHTGQSTPMVPAFPAAALSAPDADQLQRLLERGAPVQVALNLQTVLREAGHSWNVIAQLDGASRPEEIVLAGAHLDSWDLGTGAIDDGAGVAIVSTAAGLLREVPRPARSVRVVLFANEEQGIYGARAYAATHAEALSRHVMAGESDFGAGRVWQLRVAGNAAMAGWARELAGALPPVVPFSDEPARPGPDIRPLQEAGVPVFQLQQDGTDYFDYHHTADDTLDKIDPDALRHNVAAWAVLLYRAAESSQSFRPAP